MSYNSFSFLLFAVVFFALLPLTRHNIRLRLVYLGVASLVFLGWENWTSIPFLLIIAITSFYGAILFIKFEKRLTLKKLLFYLSLFIVIGSLFSVKYTVFFLSNIEALLGLAGFSVNISKNIPEFSQIMPLGISFYSLQAISYLLETYRGWQKPTYDILQYFSYLALFPKLLTGPIERGRNLLPQLLKITPVDEERRWEGLKLIVGGFFLKMVIADNLATIVNPAFKPLVVYQASAYWWGIITAFAFQIYCDFNGYSMIAVGLGKWMGYDLTTNFDNPYMSMSLSEFWKRWHISLSSWLRDYIFFPLSRSRWGRHAPVLTTLITMLVSGLWHGAAWTYIAWGALHGIYLSLERWWRWPQRLKKMIAGEWIALGLTLLQVWAAWVFFRATSLEQAFGILKAMFQFKGKFDFGLGLSGFICIAAAILYELCTYHVKIKKEQKNSLGVAFVVLLILVTIYLRGEGNVFIYASF